MLEECQTARRKPAKMKCTKGAGDIWAGLDLSSQGIRNISRSLFDLTFIRVLNLANNEIDVIPREIWMLRNLEVLNLSRNKIRNIPPELGRVVSLRELNLSDNLISNVPMEMGTLYNLEVFDISNNPLVIPFNVLSRDKKLLQFCREHNTGYPPPHDRYWTECPSRSIFYGEAISVGTFNILSNIYASKLTYAPSWVLNPEFRKEGVLQEITSYNVDILCLQEIELYSFFEFYKEQLEMRCSYDSVMCPRGRVKSVVDKKGVDGCAIFWRKNKFKLVAQFPVDFHQKVTQDTRFNNNQELLERYGKKDNVAIGVLLERPNGQQILVVNTHIFWDPEYPDVKLLQVLLLMEEVERIRERYSNAAVILQGDFNSLRTSSVYMSITGDAVDTSDFGDHCCYRADNFTANGLSLRDSYVNQDLGFTNLTPVFKEVIDYIFYGDGLVLTSVLSPIEDEYSDGVVGLPNIHFPSDHIFLGAKFAFPSKTSSTTSFGKSQR